MDRGMFQGAEPLKLRSVHLPASLRGGPITVATEENL